MRAGQAEAACRARRRGAWTPGSALAQGGEGCLALTSPCRPGSRTMPPWRHH